MAAYAARRRRKCLGAPSASAAHLGIAWRRDARLGTALRQQPLRFVSGPLEELSDIRHACELRKREQAVYLLVDVLDDLLRRRRHAECGQGSCGSSALMFGFSQSGPDAAGKMSSGGGLRRGERTRAAVGSERVASGRRQARGPKVRSCGRCDPPRNFLEYPP